MSPVILFYTSNVRAIYTTYIGYIYELSQQYGLVLCVESLDLHTKQILLNKAFFPGLKEIVDIDQYRKNESWINKSLRLTKLSNALLEKYSPKLVIASSDNDSFFELCLFRTAKKCRAHRIGISATINPASRDKVRNWCLAVSAVSFCSAFPFPLRFLLAKVRSLLGHVYVYWVLPVINGMAPFWGAPSYIKCTGHSGMRDGEAQVVFSEHEREIYIQAGVPYEKVVVIPHPLTRDSRLSFELMHGPLSEMKKRVALILHPGESFGFSSDLLPIPSEDYSVARKSALYEIISVLKDWEILIKPHPNIADMELKKTYGGLLEHVTVLSPSASAEMEISRASLVLDFPRAASTAAYYARLLKPDMPVAALDFLHEYCGDSHLSIPGISYISSLLELREFLGKMVNSATIASVQPKPLPIEGDYSRLSEFLQDKFKLTDGN